MIGKYVPSDEVTLPYLILYCSLVGILVCPYYY